MFPIAMGIAVAFGVVDIQEKETPVASDNAIARHAATRSYR